MRVPLVFTTLLCSLSFSFCAGEAGPPGLEAVPEIVAEVNGRPILRSDLIREMAGAAGLDAIGRLTQRILVEQGAQAKGVSITAQDIEQQFAADKRALSADFLRTPWEKLSPEDLIRAHYGMTLDEYKNLVIRQRLLTRRSVGDTAVPSDDELLRFFAKENDLFQEPTKYHAQHILISPFTPTDLYRSLSASRPEMKMDAYNAERKWRMNRARDRGVNFQDEYIDLDPVWQRSRLMVEKAIREIKTGQLTFEAAVKKYTQDPADKPVKNELIDKLVRSERERAGLAPGDVGWFSKKGPMVDAFFQGVKDMKPGDVAGPIRTPYGYHIVKMLEIREQPPVTYESCKEAVYRMYMDRQVRAKADKWIESLEEDAVVRIDRAKLWPPVKRNVVVLPDAGAPKEQPEEADPVVANVNGMELKRSEIWREMLRADGEEALKRLINQEVVMTLLKSMGLERLDWECANPEARPKQPPLPQPIKVSLEAVDLELNDDRLRHDAENPTVDFRDYIFAKYGQSIDEYKRKLEAAQVMMEAIRRKIKTDDATLKVQFAIAKEYYAEPEWYEVSHILIIPTGGMQNPDKNAHLQAKLIADYVCQQYQASPTPETFAQLAKENSMENRAPIRSRDGKLGPCYPDMRNPDMPESLQIYREIRKQKLEKGMVSTPIRTFRGYQIVRVDSKHAEMPAMFENVKKKVERDYLNERAKMYTDIWLTSLNNRAQVKKFIFNKTDELKLDPQGLGPKDYFPIPDK